MKSLYFLSLVSAMLLIGCSSDDRDTAQKEPSDDHVWRDQVRALKTAKEVQGLVNDSLQQQQKALEERMR